MNKVCWNFPVTFYSQFSIKGTTLFLQSTIFQKPIPGYATGIFLCRNKILLKRVPLQFKKNVTTSGYLCGESGVCLWIYFSSLGLISSKKMCYSRNYLTSTKSRVSGLSAHEKIVAIYLNSVVWYIHQRYLDEYISWGMLWWNTDYFELQNRKIWIKGK